MTYLLAYLLACDPRGSGYRRGWGEGERGGGAVELVGGGCERWSWVWVAACLGIREIVISSFERRTM